MTANRRQPPSFVSNEAYGAALTDIQVWRSLVDEVLARHHLRPEHGRMRMGTAGTFPAVLVDDQYVVKFFGPLFNGQETAAIECALYRLLATDPGVPAPSLIADGVLDPGNDGQWHYIVSSQLPGESYRIARERLSAENRRDVSRFVADVATNIHRLNPASDVDLALAPDWKRWDTFLGSQIRFCTERHRAWGTLSSQRIEQIEPFLATMPSLLDHAEPPVVLHGDLTDDHILGEWYGDRWRPTGIIDFGDARTGDRIYELVALHIECFGGDKDLLRIFLDQYGINHARLRDIAHRAMSMTLLHEYNVLETAFILLPDAGEMTILDELATAIWDVNA